MRLILHSCSSSDYASHSQPDQYSCQRRCVDRQHHSDRHNFKIHSTQAGPFFPLLLSLPPSDVSLLMSSLSLLSVINLSSSLPSLPRFPSHSSISFARAIPIHSLFGGSIDVTLNRIRLGITKKMLVPLRGKRMPNCEPLQTFLDIPY